MANTVAQQNDLFEKYRNLDFIDNAGKVAVVKEIAKLTFSKEVMEFLTYEVENYLGDSYLPDQDAPARAALAVLEAHYRMSTVRDWFYRCATDEFNSWVRIRDIYPDIIKPSSFWFTKACADIVQKFSLSAMIAACE